MDIDLYFFQTDKMVKLLHNTGFRIIDTLERRPYEEVEYQSRRAYIWTEKIKNNATNCSAAYNCTRAVLQKIGWSDHFHSMQVTLSDGPHNFRVWAETPC